MGSPQTTDDRIDELNQRVAHLQAIAKKASKDVGDIGDRVRSAGIHIFWMFAIMLLWFVGSIGSCVADRGH